MTTAGTARGDSMLQGRKALVTGATGFIGGRLVEALVEHGARVRALVRRWERAARPARFGIELLSGHLADAGAVAAAVRGCDSVFHCAWQAGAGGEAASLAGTLGLARAALAAGVRCFVHMSTVTVYGEARDGSLQEASPRTRPGSPYAAAKVLAEEALRELAKGGLQVILLQPTIVYGPWGGFWTGGLLQRLRACRLALPQRGAGLCNAVYVDDVVQAQLLAAVRESAAGEAFLVSASAPVTWSDYYGSFARMLEAPDALALVDTLPAPGSGLALPAPETLSHHLTRMEVRIDKARRVLGYRPRYDLREGMRLTEAWARWANRL